MQVQAETLVDALAYALAEMKPETFAKTVGDV